MILLIDNYDSFSYNLYQLIGSVCSEIQVLRNDECTVEEIQQMNPAAIFLSPGPGKPADAGICEQAVVQLCGRIPIFGVCLGHQAICEAFGGTVSYAQELMHGKASMVKVDAQSKIFKGLKGQISVARYHSLAAVKDLLPDCLKITASTAKGEVMAVEHREYPVYGVQFHPESILTPRGKEMLQNFLAV